MTMTMLIMIMMTVMVTVMVMMMITTQQSRLIGGAAGDIRQQLMSPR